jgi:hypothetical protein
MQTANALLEALRISVAEQGQNHLQTGKLKQFIHQNYPAAKDIAAKIVSGMDKGTVVSASSSGVSKSSGFGGRTPINLSGLKKSVNISPEASNGKPVATTKPASVIATINESDVVVAEDNEQTFTPTATFSQEDVLTLVEMDNTMILATYGRANIQELAIKLGLIVDVRKADVAYIAQFKKQLIRATQGKKFDDEQIVRK